MGKYTFSEAKWKNFDLALNFLANRMAFSYDQALERYQELSKSQEKEEFRLLIKRFIQIEYQISKNAEVPKAYQVFMD